MISMPPLHTRSRRDDISSDVGIIAFRHRALMTLRVIGLILLPPARIEYQFPR